DGTPTHSYMRMLYKYPHAAFPYQELIEENRRRGKEQHEYELLDTGVFADNRYFDVEVEYAKADVDDILMRITVSNCAAQPAALNRLPAPWGGNIWFWESNSMKARLVGGGDASISVDHPLLPAMRLVCEGQPKFLFCDNETNERRLWGKNVSGGF